MTTRSVDGMVLEIVDYQSRLIEPSENRFSKDDIDNINEFAKDLRKRNNIRIVVNGKYYRRG